MSDRLAELFGRYVEEAAAGGHPDVGAYLDRAGEERETLAGMLAAHEALHPRAAVPEDVVAARAASAPSLEWDTLLPVLREERGTSRGELVARLAAAIGHPGAREQVADYVHLLETGGLAARSVRPAVVDALAAVLAVPRDVLEAARRLAPRAGGAEATVTFARHSVADLPVASALFDDAHSRSEEVDDLFTGGDA
jgi:hypothetical protein